jgi:hypothetical protein
MQNELSVFPLWHIALTAGIAFVVSLGIAKWRHRDVSTRESAYTALVVAASILLWRLAGNVAVLNDDPIPAVSPNDVLCPVVTYVMLGIYAAARPEPAARWEHLRAQLTLVSFLINVITI